MSDRRKAIVKRLFIDGFSQNDPDVLREVLAEDFRMVSAGAIADDGSEKSASRDDLIAGMHHNHRVFEGWGFKIDHMIAEDSHVAVRWVGSGRHVGSYAGEDPTGRVVRLPGTSYFRIAGDAIDRDWVFADQLGFKTQLGLLASPDASGGVDLVRRFWRDVISDRNPDAVDELMTQGYRQHSEGIAQGAEGLKTFLRDLFAASEGMRAEVLGLVALQGYVVSTTRITFDAPPPGWRAEQTITDVFETRGDRLTAHWDIR